MISAKTNIGPLGSQSRTSTGTQDRIMRAKRISRKIHRIQLMMSPTTNTVEACLFCFDVASAYYVTPA
jgi:hypothetical protein